MTIKEIAVEKLIPYDNNPRNNENAVEAVANSIKEFGFKVPVVVDKDNVIVAGHTRIKAAKKLGMKTVPCIIADDLSEEQIKAFRLADNKTAELAEWDFEKLEKEFEGIDNIDMSAFGFENLFEEPLNIDEDEIPEVDEESEPTVKRGEIWKLGRHYLLCGDATSEEDVSALMEAGGTEADLVITDPPYNIDYKGIKDERKIYNDKMDDDKFVEFLKKSLKQIDTAYIFCSWQCAHLFKKAMEENGMPPKAMIVWDKVNPAQHLDKYYKQHELIFYFGKFGGEKTIRGDVWNFKRKQNTLHPTMKPVELLAMILKDNPEKNIVYDCFGGSGSTLIACEQTDRICYTMEIDAHYCDVIIKRWETLTGEKAERINNV